MAIKFELLTITDLYASAWNEFHAGVLEVKCKCIRWLLRHIEHDGYFDESSSVKNALMSENYEEVLRKCKGYNNVDFGSGNAMEHFETEFIEFCRVYRDELIRQGLSEKEAKRLKLLEELKKLDETTIP